MVLSMDRWVGRVAIVTGASSGIGAAIVEQLVEIGVIVAGFARRKEYMDDLAESLKMKKGKLYAIRVDMTRETDILTGFKWVQNNLGPVHILINSAGILNNTSLMDGNTSLWREMIDTNLIGLCIATREAVRDMLKNNVAGHIIHLNSVAGHSIIDLPNFNIYSASKHAVTAVAETLRKEFNSAECKIKITSVSPGLVNTDLMSNNIPAELQKDLKGTPMIRSGDVADAIFYCLSTPPDVLVQELTVRPILERI